MRQDLTTFHVGGRGVHRGREALILPGEAALTDEVHGELAAAGPRRKRGHEDVDVGLGTLAHVVHEDDLRAHVVVVAHRTVEKDRDSRRIGLTRPVLRTGPDRIVQ